MTDQERVSLLKLFIGHSSIILTGFPMVGVLRSVETVLQVHENQISPDRKIELLRGDHPDFILRDGRDLKIEELRELVHDTTALPALWDKKYLVLYYLDHAYHSSYSTLLKLIEEPPIHLSTIICASSSKRVTDTIRSRSLMFPVGGLDNQGVSWWLGFKEKKDYRDLRIRSCGGDPEIAELVDTTVLKDWSDVWDAFINGPGDISNNFLANWGDRFEAMEDSTQLACYYVLGSFLSKRVTVHPLYLEMGSLAWQARAMIRSGKINKQQSSIFLIRLYALARTVKNRLRVKV